MSEWYQPQLRWRKSAWLLLTCGPELWIGVEQQRRREEEAFVSDEE